MNSLMRIMETMTLPCQSTPIPLATSKNPKKFRKSEIVFGNGLGVEIESEENMEETLDEMSRLGFKFNNGYHETGISIRSNTKRTKAFEKAWAKNYLKFATKERPTIIGFYSVGKKEHSIQYS